ncbi:carbohydrate sulfotransferase 9-like [Lingula anatina]|uniref:Carbohydrate sulfotransferase n=1 Tax=Lingula anatina TaxID=7574 RepID=A0A1S3JW47_LINAN|nr:carbohydrate sulfotransferase 9-like [Lingula anatina]|eukprot:XP_013414291.2 carbohydrate sulfotransferase 9-like [Lingula anatina]
MTDSETFDGKVPNYWRELKNNRLSKNPTPVKFDDRILGDANTTVKFDDFIRHVMDVYDPVSKYLKDDLGLFDHWIEVFQLCNPCEMKYDIIGEFDTMTEDAANVLKLIGTKVQFPNSKFINGDGKGYKHARGNTKELAKYVYQRLPETYREVLNDVFKVDARLFGYRL